MRIMILVLQEKKKQIKPRSTTCLIVKTHVCSLYYGIFGSVLSLQNFIRSYYASDDDHFCYGKLSKMTKTKPAPVGSWLLASPATTLDWITRRWYCLISATRVCATAKALVFVPFWSENRYRLYPLFSGTRVEGATRVYKRIVRFNSKRIRKKEEY